MDKQERTLKRVIEVAPDRVAVYNYAHIPSLFKPQQRIRETDLPSPDTRLKLLTMATLGVLIYGAITLWLAGAQLHDGPLTDGVPMQAARVNVLAQTAWVFYWTFALIILFNFFFC